MSPIPAICTLLSATALADLPDKPHPRLLEVPVELPAGSCQKR
jgi:hypothetical protein